MTQIMLAIAVGLICTTLVLAEEQLQRESTENDSNKISENSGVKIVEERGFGDKFCICLPIFGSKWKSSGNPEKKKLNTRQHESVVDTVAAKEPLKTTASKEPKKKRFERIRKFLSSGGQGANADVIPAKDIYQMSECERSTEQESRELQSPINIDTKKLTEKSAKIPSTSYEDFEVKVNVRMEKNTKRLEFIYTLQQLFLHLDPTTTGRPDYELISMRIHFPARHTINGEKFAAEVEFLHKENVRPLAKASKMYAVSVLLRYEETPNERLKLFLSDIKKAHRKATKGKSAMLDVASIISSNDLSSYYWYEGTQMTQPCTHPITRYIVKNIKSISKSQAELWAVDQETKQVNDPPTPDKGHVFQF